MTVLINNLYAICITSLTMLLKESRENDISPTLQQVINSTKLLQYRLPGEIKWSTVTSTILDNVNYIGVLFNKILT